MKRFAPLALIVLALAAVPVAFGDDAPPSLIPTGNTPAAQTQQHAPLQLQIVRLQLRLAELRYRVACQEQGSDRCTQFTQKAVERLTTLDGKVQSKLTDLKCTAGSSAAANTDKKCAVLTKLDSKLQDVLAKLSA